MIIINEYSVTVVLQLFIFNTKRLLQHLNCAKTHYQMNEASVIHI